MRRLFLAALMAVAAAPASAQDVPLEYRVKAAYLYNFVKFVDWPERAASGPITICVAGRNPFGTVLADTIRGETVNGRALTSRVILEPESGCAVLFVPDGPAAQVYLRSTNGAATLTVGESPQFLAEGGIISFALQGGRVRFDINAQAAERAELRISSRLLQLARNSER